MQERNLKFSDWPMFDRVMETNPDICRRVLEVVLGISVEEVVSVTSEQSITPHLGSHGVRLDVVVGAGESVYDVELQCYDRGSLGRRMRYYQAAMDTSALRPGEDYEQLPQSYVIFLCTFDPFAQNLPVYTFDMICDENARVHLDHGFTWLVVNASAWRTLPEGSLRNLLQYVANQDEGDDPLVKSIASAVEEANGDALWRREGLAMLTLEEDMRMYADRMHRKGLEEGREEGLLEGRNQGFEEGAAKSEERMAALMAFLLENGRKEDALAAATDSTRRAELLAELKL